MRSQVSEFNSGLKPEDVLVLIQAEVPSFNKIVNLDEGIYSMLGEFAIYLRDVISEGSISESELQNVFGVMNTMGASKDLEVKNLLVVGIFEILTDIDEVIEIIRQGLEGEAAELFERVLIGWTQ